MLWSLTELHASSYWESSTNFGAPCQYLTPFRSMPIDRAQHYIVGRRLSFRMQNAIPVTVLRRTVDDPNSVVRITWSLSVSLSEISD